MKAQIKSIISLFSICVVVALALSLTNYFTSAVIEERAKEEVRQSLLEVLPEGGSFEQIEDISTLSLPETVSEVYKESNGGYVFKLITSGYAPNMNIMCGIGSDGSIKGAICLSSGETLGQEKTYGDNFVGKDKKSLTSVSTVSGATKTTSAYRAALGDALDAFEILKNN